jgi:hypothetical protein
MKTFLIAFAATAALGLAGFSSSALADDAPAAPSATAAGTPTTESSPVRTGAAASEGYKKPRALHHAKWHNGHGSTWKSGRDKYDFIGSYGGCKYRGSAGTWGYHIDRTC